MAEGDNSIFNPLSFSEEPHIEAGKAIVSGVLSVLSLITMGGMKPVFEMVPFLEDCMTVPFGIFAIATLGLAFLHGVVATK